MNELIMMAHRWCLADNDVLIAQLNFNAGFTAVQYFFIAYCLFKVGLISTRPTSHWRALFNSLGWVFIFCAANYIMDIVVIYTPAYYTQILILWIGNAVFVKAVVHLMKADKGKLKNLFKAISMSIKAEKL